MNAARLFAALMELAKTSALASCCFLAIGRPLPAAAYAASLFAALGLSRASRRGGTRVAVYLALNAAGLALSFLAARAAVPELSLGPSRFPFRDGRLPVELSVLAWSAVFWLRGEWLGKKKPDHAFCVARFDEGLTVFLLSLSAGALLRTPNPVAERVFLPFLLFGLLALGASRQTGSRAGGLVHGSGKTGLYRVAASFVLGSAGLLFLVPALLEPARIAKESIVRALKAAEPGIAAFLRWLFGFRPPAYAAPDASSGPAALSRAPVEEIGKAGKALAGIIVWFLVALSAAAILASLAFALAALVKRLSGKIQGDREGPPPLPFWLLTVLRRLARLLYFVRSPSLRRTGRRSAAASAYARFLRTGGAAGCARAENETPREYAGRLARLFPRSARQAPFVVEALEREVYGGQILDSGTERRLVGIRRETRSLSFHSERVQKKLGIRKKA